MSRIMGFIHDRLEANGHHVDYLTADHVSTKWQAGVGRRFAFPLIVRHTADEAARNGRPYDIVNVHEPHAFPITVLRAAAGEPSVVITSHGLEHRAWGLVKEEARLSRQPVALKTRLTYPPTSLWPTGIALRMADHVFCLSADDRDELVRSFGRNTDNTTRIFPGSDLVYVSTNRDYSRAARVLFAAAWRHNKGITDLVPAFTALAAQYDALTLAIVGAGVPEAAIRAAFPQMMQRRLTIQTPPTEAEMASTFATADLFLLPSLFEGTPLTLIQAMMSGLPIVTTATCGMKDVIKDEETGLLIPVRSPEAIRAAVSRLVGDRQLRERLGRAAQATAVAKYTWDRVAQPIEEVYLRLKARIAA
ncbi:MAG: glycosyltransferase family 1 protein [Acidobacteria bacterium]|nr:MAG: glycosyltransferase family 1 protein [Acidobacteriota bacterium]